MTRKKILIIAYYFPPAGGGGVQRPTKFVKYLREFGWQPLVLTTTEDSFIETDASIVNDIPEDVEIIRIRSGVSKRLTYKIRQRTQVVLPAEKKSQPRSVKAKLARFVRNWFLIPDSQIFWIFSIAFSIRKIIKEYQPDVVLATGPPYSTLLTALFVKPFFNKSVALDFRDPWSQLFNTLRKSESGFRKALETWLEKQVIKRADLVLGVTEDMVDYFIQQYQGKPGQKFELIYNGYDKDDFEGVAPKKYNKYTIVYTGKITTDLYSAKPFIQALSQVFEQDKSLRDRIEVRFIGAFDEPVAQTMIERLNLKEQVKIEGYLPHAECVASQLGADLLLLTLNRGIPEALTGKVFEYLYTEKPILALTPEDSQVAGLLRKCSHAVIAPPDCPDQIAACILDLVNNRLKIQIDRNFAKPFHRKEQCLKLAKLLNEVVG